MKLLNHYEFEGIPPRKKKPMRKAAKEEIPPIIHSSSFQDNDFTSFDTNCTHDEYENLQLNEIKLIYEIPTNHVTNHVTNTNHESISFPIKKLSFHHDLDSLVLGSNHMMKKVENENLNDPIANYDQTHQAIYDQSHELKYDQSFCSF